MGEFNHAMVVSWCVFTSKVKNKFDINLILSKEKVFKTLISEAFMQELYRIAIIGTEVLQIGNA